MGESIKIFTMVWTEIIMELKTRIKYWMASISDFVVFSLTYLAVLLFTNVDNMNRVYSTRHGVLLVLIGYMFWNTGVVAMDVASQSIESDSKTGILGTELQSRYPFWFLTLIRGGISNLLLFIYLFMRA